MATPIKYQPNSHHCFVCGLKNPAGLRARFQIVGDNGVRVVTQICDQHQGYPGIAHGGVLAALVDEGMGRAASVLHPGKFYYTVKMEITYRKPVPLNTDIIATASITDDQGVMAMATSAIHLAADQSLAVEATAMLMPIPDQEVAHIMASDDLGWRVYTDDEFEQQS